MAAQILDFAPMFLPMTFGTSIGQKSSYPPSFEHMASSALGNNCFLANPSHPGKWIGKLALLKSFGADLWH